MMFVGITPSASNESGIIDRQNFVQMTLENFKMSKDIIDI